MVEKMKSQNEYYKGHVNTILKILVILQSFLKQL